MGFVADGYNFMYLSFCLDCQACSRSIPLPFILLLFNSVSPSACVTGFVFTDISDMLKCNISWLRDHANEAYLYLV